MATTYPRITSDEIATAFIQEHEPQTIARIVDGKIRISLCCLRCGGSGRGPWFQDGGICYECHGRNTTNSHMMQPVKVYAQKLKRQIKAREKKIAERQARAEAKIERQRDWCEANGHGRITFAELDQKRAAERDAEKAKAEDCPTGRVVLTGTVLKTDEKRTAFGFRFVLTMKDDRGFLVWGSIPSDLELFDDVVEDENGDCLHVQRTLQKGDRITFTATVEPSPTDSKFGFYKRPAKAELLK